MKGVTCPVIMHPQQATSETEVATMKDKTSAEDEPKETVFADLPGVDEEVKGMGAVDAGVVPPERVEVTRA